MHPWRDANLKKKKKKKEKEREKLIRGGFHKHFLDCAIPFTINAQLLDLKKLLKSKVSSVKWHYAQLVTIMKSTPGKKYIKEKKMRGGFQKGSKAGHATQYLHFLHVSRPLPVTIFRMSQHFFLRSHKFSSKNCFLEVFLG